MTLHELELAELYARAVAELLRLRSEMLLLLVELALERGEVIERAGDQPGGYYHRGPLPDSSVPF